MKMNKNSLEMVETTEFKVEHQTDNFEFAKVVTKLKFTYLANG